MRLASGGKMPKEKLYSFRLDEDTYKKLEKIAVAEERSCAYLIRKAIERIIQEKGGKKP
jgi:predicted DNA-binding protein